MNEEKILFKQESYLIAGAIFQVYKELGCGFLEAVYQECLEREFLQQKIPFIAQKELKLYYKGNLLKQNYKADLICYDKIIIEIKAVKVLNPIHQAQLVNYLKASDFVLGLLVNFGSYPKVEVKRMVNT